MSPKFSAAVELRGIDNVSPTFARVGAKLGAPGKKFKRVGRLMTAGITLPVIAMGAGIFKTTADFSKGMNRVKALTGAASKEMEKMTAQAMLMGRTTEFSAGQAARSQAALAQAGFDTSEIMESLPGAMNLASAGQLELAEATSIAVDTLKGFGKPASEMTWVTDVLAKSAAIVNTTVGEMGEAFKMAGPVSKAAGQQFTTTAAVLAGIADGGFKATMGGTAFRQMLLSLVNITPLAQKALTGLGLKNSDLFDETGKLRDFVEVVAAFEKVGAGTNLKALGQVFGARGVGPMAALINAGADRLSELKGEVVNAAGTNAKFAKTLLEGEAGAWARLSSAMNGLALTIGKSGVVDMIASLMGKIGEGALWLGKVNPEVLKFGAGALALAATLGPLAIGLGAVALGVSAITWPVLAVIAGVTALGVAGLWLWANWNSVLDSLGKGWENLKDLFFGTLNEIVGGFTWLFEQLPEPLQNLLGGSASNVKLSGRVDTSHTASAAFPGKANKARLEIDVKGGSQDVTAKLVENDGFDVMLDQGASLAGAF